MIKIEDVDSTLKKDLKKTRGEVDKVLTQVIITQLYKNRFCGLVLIPEVIDDIR